MDAVGNGRDRGAFSNDGEGGGGASAIALLVAASAVGQQKEIVIGVQCDRLLQSEGLSARSTDAKADATHSVDEPIGLLALDLATNAPDIHVDEVGRRVEREIPDILQ